MTAERVLAPPGAAYGWRWWALAALLPAEAMNLLDATIVQVAAPAVHADLGGPVSDVQWFTTAYTLPFAVLLITGGRLGDIAGRRRVFVGGVTGFLFASVACALAPGAGPLIAFRVVQGAAAALVIPQTIGLIKAMFAGAELARALGAIGPVMGLAAVCGPVLGGFLTHADLFGSSWRAAFLVNVPLSLLVLALAPKLVDHRAPRSPTLDLTGTLPTMAGVGLVVHPLIGADLAALSGWNWASIGAGLMLMAVFVRHQRGAVAAGRSPLVEPSWGHLPAVAGGLCAPRFPGRAGGLGLVLRGDQRPDDGDRAPAPTGLARGRNGGRAHTGTVDGRSGSGVLGGPCPPRPPLRAPYDTPRAR
ncbi:MFS transporter, partial [Streptomyces rimosus]